MRAKGTVRPSERPIVASAMILGLMRELLELLEVPDGVFGEG